ncbi:MAG: hypothetical protein EOP82_32585 [Variovorax sp.]|nr:MAG: hypothetical protein EOP82_32585 [Variovorax sp.]
MRTHNLEVVHSIVAIMQARGWQAVRLTGTQEFRQKVWHEATLQGIGVQGYEPSALEMQQLQRALDRDQAMHRARQPSQDRTAPSPELDPSADERRSPRDGLRPPTVGVLLAHAAAPYRFDPMQRMSYYVRVQTEVGERTLWGTDLERALAESRSGAQVGDEVVLSQHGARPVTVRVPDRNAKGELVGDKKLLTQRMAWSVEKVQYIESLNRKADMFRSGVIAVDAVLSQYPDLTGAMAGLRLAEQFARRLTPRADEQARVVQAIRTGLADAIAQGQQIKLPPERARQTHAHHRGRSVPALEDPGHPRA